MRETVRESALLLLSHLLVKKINIIMLKVNVVSVSRASIKFSASALRYLSVMLILIGTAKVVLAKQDLLSGQQENVKNALLQLLFAMKIHHGTEIIAPVTLAMLLLLENVKSTLHLLHFATKTQYGMVKFVFVSPAM